MTTNQNEEQTFPLDINILVLEDEDHFLRNLDKSFVELKISGDIVFTRDGEEGYNELVSRRTNKNLPDFDLICLDIHMPKVDGIEFLKMIRKEPRFKNIPVLVLTVEDSMNLVTTCIREGCSSYLIKPWAHSDELRERLSNAWFKHHIYEDDAFDQFVKVTLDDYRKNKK